MSVKHGCQEVDVRASSLSVSTGSKCYNFKSAHVNFYQFLIWAMCQVASKHSRKVLVAPDT